ncbi:CATRA system-associated protein [Actinokineospora diospyrosa]|uniref:CATRA-Associated Small Protein domain-containing protein n=1 Tax=Actinokineospora diospyrosa TaxID=103728 RepID=A0ABT1I9Q5_9PSEU|nr:CATRA system-associated protein [Actinokineospora diospyrosa]MCP2269369.1 hypothetical protein [Actinokineospora diospyrosa]
MRIDSAAVLHEVLTWRMVGTRWRAVAAALDELAAAVADDDVEEVRRVLHELDMAAPTRVLRIEDALAVGVPEAVRERVNQLVHTLDAERPTPEREEPPAPR